MSTVLSFDLPAGVTAVQARPFGTGYADVAPIQFSLTAGAGTGAITPSGLSWCWVFREVGIDGRARVCSVPDTNLVLYADLPDVDPATFTPQAEPPVAAWTVALGGVASSVAAITASSLGLGSVNNTPDSAKPVSTPQAAALAAVTFPATSVITYNPDGSVDTVTESGVLTTYAYNADGTVHTDTRAGVTRTYTYDGSGNLTGISV